MTRPFTGSDANVGDHLKWHSFSCSALGTTRWHRSRSGYMWNQDIRSCCCKFGLKWSEASHNFVMTTKWSMYLFRNQTAWVSFSSKKNITLILPLNFPDKAVLSFLHNKYQHSLPMNDREVATVGNHVHKSVALTKLGKNCGKPWGVMTSSHAMAHSCHN